MAKLTEKERKAKQAEIEAKKNAKNEAELKEAEEKANAANPAETAKDNGQKTDNNAIDNEPVEESSFKPGIIVDNPAARATGTLRKYGEKANPIEWGKKAVEDWEKGQKGKAILDATGLPSVVEGLHDASETAKNGVATTTADSPIYNEKYEQEKELKKMEEEAKKTAETPVATTQPATEESAIVEAHKDATAEPEEEYKSLLSKINDNYGNVYGEYTKKLPTFMTAAYKNGAFGTPGTKDARTRLGYFIANHIGTTLGNMLGGIGNAAMANAGKAGTYQTQQSDWDKMRETNLMKGLDTTWQAEQGQLQNNLSALNSLTGMDVDIVNTRNKQNSYINQAEELGRHYESLSEYQKQSVVAGELFKKYQENGDPKALAGASAIVEMQKPENRAKASEMWESIKKWLGI